MSRPLASVVAVQVDETGNDELARRVDPVVRAPGVAPADEHDAIVPVDQTAAPQEAVAPVVVADHIPAMDDRSHGTSRRSQRRRDRACPGMTTAGSVSPLFPLPHRGRGQGEGAVPALAGTERLGHRVRARPAQPRRRAEGEAVWRSSSTTRPSSPPTPPATCTTTPRY